MQEIWKDIKEYEGLYQISNFGNVRSVDRVVRCNTGYANIKGKLLKPTLTKKGYYKASLSKNSKEKKFFIHRLVALHFLENPFNKEQINHIDGNKINNRYDNLEFCTNYENYVHAKRTGLIDKNVRIQQAIKMGEKNRKPIAQFTKDGKFVKEYISIIEASRQTGLSHQNISNCLSPNQKKSKSAGGYVWKYIDKKEE